MRKTPKEVAHEIRQLLKENDLAGSFIIHSNRQAEFVNELSPSWSCLKIDDEGARIKTTHLPDQETKKEYLECTAGMIGANRDWHASNFLNYDKLMSELEKHVEIELNLTRTTGYDQ